jgi:ketosteroid isomerase-like protein
MFFPRPENAREVYSKRPPSPAALTWNPIRIEVSGNGALAYSIGNSIYRPKGKDDTNAIHGHYLSVWSRQPSGEYRAVLDTGINHEKPSTNVPDWKPGSAPAPEANEKKSFAGDSSIGFYRMAEDRGFGRAYKAYGADDMYLMRDGKLPIIGRNAAANYIEDQGLAVRFVKRRSYIEAGDLAYVYSGYMLLDKKSVEKERGSYVQVWKLRGGRWVIAADVFIPIPPDKA